MSFDGPFLYERICNQIADGFQGRHRFVFVSGAPGMGKTTLLNRIADRLHDASVAPAESSQAVIDHFDKLMTLNVTSTWRIIRSLDPLLRLSDAGRALLLSSSVAHSARAYWGPYAASKAAVETLARSWAEENLQTRLKVNSVDPGATRTAMRAQAAPGEDPMSLPHPSEVGAKIARLAYPDVSETGKLYVVRQNRFVSYQLPQ